MARVAIYGGGGAPYHHAMAFTRAGHETHFVFAPDIVTGALTSFDAFVMPGGGYFAMEGQLRSLGERGCMSIQSFVQGGGLYVGSCAGSFLAVRAPAEFLVNGPEQVCMPRLNATIWNPVTARPFDMRSPGVGVIVVENINPSHPVMAQMPPSFPLVYYNGPLFRGGEALARVSHLTDDFTPAESFLGGHSEGILIEEAARARASCIIAGPLDRGRVVLFGGHPEFGQTIGLDDQSVAERLLTNALEWQLSEVRERTGEPDALVAAEVGEAVVERDRANLPSVAARIRESCAELASLQDERGWLRDHICLSMFGRSCVDLWAESLATIPKYVDEVITGSELLSPAFFSFRPPTSWSVDWGFRGAVPLLLQAEQQLVTARELWTRTKPPAYVSDPYEHMLDNPYHLVAGSYLAAVGSSVAAALLARMSVAQGALSPDGG